jgi:Niemann-Pick C1 protein
MMSRALQVVATGAFLLASVGSAEDFTPIHEAGRCAIRGHCGSKSFFGKQLPCVDNGLAADPEDDVRKQLVELCGAKWETGPVCCNADQVCFLFPLVVVAMRGSQV